MLKAIVTGAGGQDGSYLCEYLLSLNYLVFGVVKRRSTAIEYDNLKKCQPNTNFKLLYGDIEDETFISRILYDIKPHEYYGLAAESHVGYSFSNPLKVFDVNAKAVISQLELIKSISPSTRFYNAATSELWGNQICPKTGFNEESNFSPRSPYAVAKAAAYYATKNYREAYSLFAVSGISCNHSSPRRGVDFATRKITNSIAKIKLGKQQYLEMGDLSAFRDESHAKDIVIGMHKMLQSDTPKDYVLSSGVCTSIKEMAEYVANIAELNFYEIYKLDHKFIRPSEVPFLLGDSSKIKKELNWHTKYNVFDILKEMYQNDLNLGVDI